MNKSSKAAAGQPCANIPVTWLVLPISSEGGLWKHKAKGKDHQEGLKPLTLAVLLKQGGFFSPVMLQHAKCRQTTEAELAKTGLYSGGNVT